MPIKVGDRGNAGHCSVPSPNSGLQLARTDFSACAPQLHGLSFSPGFLVLILVLLKAGKKQESSGSWCFTPADISYLFTLTQFAAF